jgi:hypothetical protein
MLKTITFSVTEQDIQEGKKGHCYKCPIALAVMRAVPEAEVVEVNWFAVYIDSVYKFDYSQPDLVLKFMEDFDLGKPVFPFSGVLER